MILINCLIQLPKLVSNIILYVLPHHAWPPAAGFLQALCHICQFLQMSRVFSAAAVSTPDGYVKI